MSYFLFGTPNRNLWVCVVTLFCSHPSILSSSFFNLDALKTEVKGLHQQDVVILLQRLWYCLDQ